MAPEKADFTVPILLAGAIVALKLDDFWQSLSDAERFLFGTLAVGLLAGLLAALYEWKSPKARERRERLKRAYGIPEALRTPREAGVFVGRERELGVPIYLPNAIRLRHVHVVGATGSGKSESVILSFLRQDVQQGLGAILLDGKGDASFLAALRRIVPSERLRVFDLGDSKSLSYNPLFAGSPEESAQRLFASLSWSEPYYRSRAFAALQRIYEHLAGAGRNPTIAEIADALSTAEDFSDAVSSPSYPLEQAQKDFGDLAGLRDQVQALAMGPLGRILSPNGEGDLRLEEAGKGTVLYFRLQSLISPETVAVVGKLLIHHLAFLAGTAHRQERACSAFIPTYLDEFATFACPEFADLISKARSAGLALHFSHQSVGDLVDVAGGFLSRITDNSATKIVLRVNDPDTAEFFARSFGTRIIQKATQRVTNAKDLRTAEVLGEGTIREAHQFRASPDLFKSLPTGTGAVLVSHGLDMPEGATSVLRVQFPRLDLNTSSLDANQQSS